MVVVKGTPEERKAARELNRQANRVQFVRDRATRTDSGHQKVVVACNAALAASRRITDDVRKHLAKAIADAVVQADVPENRKERP